MKMLRDDKGLGVIVDPETPALVESAVQRWSDGETAPDVALFYASQRLDPPAWPVRQAVWLWSWLHYGRTWLLQVRGYAGEGTWGMVIPSLVHRLVGEPLWIPLRSMAVTHGDLYHGDSACRESWRVVDPWAPRCRKPDRLGPVWEEYLRRTYGSAARRP